MKRKLFKKIGILVFSVIFGLNIGFENVNAQQAGISWGETYSSLPMDTLMDEALRVFNESITSALKRIAIKLVMDRVRALILGQSGGGSRIIADYGDYVYGYSERVTKGVVRDFFSTVNQSASSATRSMYRDIEKTVTNEISPVFDNLKPQVDNRLTGGEKDLFRESRGGGISTFYLHLTNDMDNVVGARLAIQERIDYLREKTREEQRAKYQVGGGMQGIEDKNGLVSLPGKIVADIQTFVETMEMRALVSAQKLPEVIGGTAAMMVTQVLQSGIDKVMKPVDNQLKNINKSVKGGINKVQKDIYKGIEFDGKK